MPTALTSSMTKGQTSTICASTAGANFHDVELMVKGVHGRCKVKAAGGISTVEDMEKFLALGADRLGTSRAVKLLNGEQAKGY